MLRERLGGKSGIEANADVIIKSIGSRQLAVGSFYIGRLPRARVARIFGEIKVSDHRVDIAFPQASELTGKSGVVRRSKAAPPSSPSSSMLRKMGKLRFQLLEVPRDKLFCRRQVGVRILILKKVEIRIIAGPRCRGAAVSE